MKTATPKPQPAPKTAKKSSLLPADLYDLTDADYERFASEIQLGLLAPDSTVLSEAAKAVPADKITTQKVQRIIERMRKIASGQRESEHASKRKGRGMVGLAAPQIGELHQIILVDTHVSATRKSFGKLECFINPEIVWRSRETEEGREGCFSAGPVWGVVRRPVAVKIKALDQRGEMIERILEGFSARIVQHEIDHLAGIRFPERITRDHKMHWVHTEELKEYSDLYKKWHRICGHDRWEAVKRGKIKIA